MQETVRTLLTELGEDPEREGLKNTPRRVEKAMKFLTSGYQADVDAIINDALFTVDYNEMVIVKDIDFYSMCEHHLLPFFGKCHIAYIPDGRVIGLSKIPRLVDVFARRHARLPERGVKSPRARRGAARPLSDPGPANQLQKFHARARVVAEDAVHCARDREGVLLLHAAHRHA